MSFRGRLHINGSSQYSNILKFTMNLSQSVDSQNRPNAVASGGIVNITLEASRNNELMEWMVSPNMTKTGFINFARRDGESAMSNIHFRDAFCINYNMNFDAEDETPMTIEITISARVLDFEGGLTITNRWPGDYQDESSSSSSSSGESGVVVLPPDEDRYTNPQAMEEEMETMRDELEQTREHVSETVEAVRERVDDIMKDIDTTREQANQISNDLTGEDIPNPSDMF